MLCNKKKSSLYLSEAAALQIPEPIHPSAAAFKCPQSAELGPSAWVVPEPHLT